jgi:hypothetical protein
MINIIKEKGLSRIYNKIQDHDCGMMTAYRSEYNYSQNQQRNKNLIAKLFSLRYGVTAIRGGYIENYNTPDAKEVSENSYFIEDSNDHHNLKSDLIKLGEYFDQDSILFIEHGGVNSYLIGTSHRENSYPGFGVFKIFKNTVFGQNGEFHTKVSGRPFIFKESIILKDYVLPQGMFGRWGCSEFAKMDWDKM